MEEFLIGKGTVGDGERIVRRKKIGDHRQQIGTGGDDRRGVGAGDAANGGDGQIGKATARGAQQVEGRGNGLGLHRGGIDGAEGDVVGAGGDGGISRLQAVVAADAEHAPGTEGGPRRGQIAVFAAEVHTVGADVQGEIQMVVDDEAGAGVVAETLQFRRLLAAMPPEGPEDKSSGTPGLRPSATSPLPLTTPGISSSAG